MTTQNEKAEIQLSPDYQYLAIAYQDSNSNGFVRLYKNNNANFVLYGCYKVAGGNTGSLDFSPESKYLYLVSHTAANRGIIRLNVGLLTPNNTPTGVASQAIDYATTLFNLNNTAITGIAYSSIRRAKNGNMYVAYTGSRQLFAIKNPDVANIANITTLSVQLTQALKGGISAQPIIYYSFSKRSGNEPLFATRERGSKVYELNDHLGNVRSVVSDIKELILPDAASSGNISVTGTSATTSATTTALVSYNSLTDNDNFRANILTLNNYYPYGMLQPGRSVSSGTYRFGYQGQEMDNAISALGQHLNYTYRNYDSWTARFGAIDPLAAKYPHNSTYAFSENRVIDMIELEGLEATYPMPAGNNGQAAIDNTSMQLYPNNHAFKLQQVQADKTQKNQQYFQTANICTWCKAAQERREFWERVEGTKGHPDPFSPFRSYLTIKSAITVTGLFVIPPLYRANRTYFELSGLRAAQDFSAEFTMAKGDLNEMDWANIGSNILPQNKIIGGMLAKSVFDAMADYKMGKFRTVLDDHKPKLADVALLEGTLDFAVGAALHKYSNYLNAQNTPPDEYIKNILI